MEPLTRARLFGLLCGLLLGVTASAVAEDIKVETYYPSPRGVYNELRTIGNTNLASQSGTVTVGSGPGSVVLGVQGSVQIVDGSEGDRKILSSDASGVATWEDDGAPSGMIAMFAGGGCPAGWSPFGFGGRFL